MQIGLHNLHEDYLRIVATDLLQLHGQLLRTHTRPVRQTVGQPVPTMATTSTTCRFTWSRQAGRKNCSGWSIAEWTESTARAGHGRIGQR